MGLLGFKPPVKESETTVCCTPIFSHVHRMGLNYLNSWQTRPIMCKKNPSGNIKNVLLLSSLLIGLGRFKLPWSWIAWISAPVGPPHVAMQLSSVRKLFVLPPHPPYENKRHLFAAWSKYILGTFPGQMPSSLTCEHWSRKLNQCRWHRKG